MLPISTKEIVRFVPEECRKLDNPPTYLLAVPTEWGKAEFGRQMTTIAGKRPSDEHFRQALREGICEVVPVDQQEEQLATVQQHAAEQIAHEAAKAAHTEAAEHAEDNDLPPPPPFKAAEGFVELDRRVTNIEDRIAALYPPYAALLAARQRHDDYLPVMAARLFLKGVENVDVPFNLTAGRVSDETLAALDSHHLVRVGYELLGMMYVSRKQEKNSESPSRSPSAPAISGVGESRRTRSSSGGSSVRNSAKTPAS